MKTYEPGTCGFRNKEGELYYCNNPDHRRTEDDYPECSEKECPIPRLDALSSIFIENHHISFNYSLKNPICPHHNKRAIFCEPILLEDGSQGWFCIDCVMEAIMKAWKFNRLVKAGFVKETDEGVSTRKGRLFR